MKRLTSWYVIGVLVFWWGVSLTRALFFEGEPWSFMAVLAWSLALPLPFVLLSRSRARSVQRKAPPQSVGRNASRTP